MALNRDKLNTLCVLILYITLYFHYSSTEKLPYYNMGMIIMVPYIEYHFIFNKNTFFKGFFILRCSN